MVLFIIRSEVGLIDYIVKVMIEAVNPIINAILISLVGCSSIERL